MDGALGRRSIFGSRIILMKTRGDGENDPYTVETGRDGADADTNLTNTMPIDGDLEVGGEGKRKERMRGWGTETQSVTESATMLWSAA